MDKKRALLMIFEIGLTAAGSAIALVSESIQLNIVTLLIAFGYGAVGYTAGAQDADKGDI